jgi:hypothetical protein
MSDLEASFVRIEIPQGIDSLELVTIRRIAGMKSKPSYLILSLVLIFSFSLYSQSDCMAALVEIEIYGYGVEDPEELAFDSAGNLYVGRSLNEHGVSIYQIPAGGGEAVAWPGSSGPFDDPDGIDVDDSGVVWGTTGIWDDKQKGEVISVFSDGTFEALGGNYLNNPTSLELDRNGRFGPEGSVLVANKSNSTEGIELLLVTTEPLSVTNIFDTSGYDVIRSLDFDEDNTLWFVGGDNLYYWANGARRPREFELPGVTGAMSAVAADPFGDGLVVGLIDERAVARVSFDGNVDIIATGLDPKALAIDSLGRIYVSDQVSDVVWIIPEPSTLFLLAIGGLALMRKSGKS